MESLKIYHKDWNDNLFIKNDNYIFRESNDNEKGTYFFIDKLLLIDWEKWNPEIFIKDKNNDYYLFDTLNINTIHLIHSDWNSVVILDIELKKIYRKNDIKINGTFILKKNKLLINWESTASDNPIYENFIYFDFKYYEEKLFLKDYEIIKIYENKLNSKDYLLSRNSNIIYEDYLSSNKIGTYIKYKNKLSIFYGLNNETFAPLSIVFDKNNEYYINNPSGNQLKYKIFYKGLNRFIKEEDDTKYSGSQEGLSRMRSRWSLELAKDSKSNNYYSYENKNDFDLKMIKSENMLCKDGIKIIIGVLDIYNIINYIDFLNNFICIILNKLENKPKNKIYDDLNILYYDVNKGYDAIIQKCKQYFKNIDENYNIEIIDFKKVEDKNSEDAKDAEINLLMIGKNDIKDDIIKKKWYLLNKDKIEKYQNILDISGVFRKLHQPAAEIMHKLAISVEINDNNFGIPKIFHFIWIGPNKFPEDSKIYIESWKKLHPDYMFCFWDNNNIPLLYNQNEYDNSTVMAMKADILRYELLYIFGGIYVDCDFKALKNIDGIIRSFVAPDSSGSASEQALLGPTELIKPNGYIGFSGYECKKYIAIGLMGFCSGDIVLHNIIKYLSLNMKIHSDAIEKHDIPRLSGPKYFTEMWNIYKTDLHYAFPPEYFYSYSFEDKLYEREYKTTENNYAIHFWNHSWK